MNQRPAMQIDRKNDIRRQIDRGILVCPQTRNALSFTSPGTLASADGERSYNVHGDVPLLITDRGLVDEYARSSGDMNREYSTDYLQSQQSWFAKLRQKDYRTQESIDAFDGLFSNVAEDAVCLSVGGGPGRAHPRLTNLNIAPFPNVDVVGDAHLLPYADASVDVLYCEAVLEHLHTPSKAVAEMFRVLKPGGRVFACTPFLQPYHGYPHHYQNFTLTGHVHLFATAGFQVTQSGTSTGPVYALRSLTGVFLKTHLPFPLNRILHLGWAVFSLLVAPLDLIVAKRKDAHILASTTYLTATKR